MDGKMKFDPNHIAPRDKANVGRKHIYAAVERILHRDLTIKEQSHLKSVMVQWQNDVKHAATLKIAAIHDQYNTRMNRHAQDDPQCHWHQGIEETFHCANCCKHCCIGRVTKE